MTESISGLAFISCFLFLIFAFVDHLPLFFSIISSGGGGGGGGGGGCGGGGG